MQNSFKTQTTKLTKKKKEKSSTTTAKKNLRIGWIKKKTRYKFANGTISENFFPHHWLLNVYVYVFFPSAIHSFVCALIFSFFLTILPAERSWLHGNHVNNNKNNATILMYQRNLSWIHRNKKKKSYRTMDMKDIHKFKWQ